MMINQEKSLVDINRIKNFYEDYFKKVETSCGWSYVESAADSYGAASNCSKQDWTRMKSVLDVGSGEGNFLSYLRTRIGFTGKYTGLELLLSSHTNAVKLYGKDPLAEFMCDEFLGYDFGDQQFDWIISLGTLSVKQDRQEEHDQAMVKKMINLAKCGISIYVNDSQKIAQDRKAIWPDLATHNVSDFMNFLNNEFNPKELTFNHFPNQESPKTMIHLVLR